MTPGKHQRSSQRCKGLCWKARDDAQSFVLHSYTMHELCSQHDDVKSDRLKKGGRPIVQKFA